MISKLVPHARLGVKKLDIAVLTQSVRAQPFNFPLEIPALQVLGALFMGNKPLVHVDHRCAFTSPVPIGRCSLPREACPVSQQR